MRMDCPFKNCHYSINVYSSFNAHKSRNHAGIDVLEFKNEIVLTDTDSPPLQSGVESDEAGPSRNSPELDNPDCHRCDDTGELQDQLRNNLASLFLKMHSVLHVPAMAIQEIVDNLVQILSMSKPLVKDSIVIVLQEYHQSMSDARLNELVEPVMKSNVFVSATEEGAELSTAKWRKTFVRNKYSLMMPVQCTVGCNGHTAVYVPILQVLQTMLENTDILDNNSRSHKSFATCDIHFL